MRVRVFSLLSLAMLAALPVRAQVWPGRPGEKSCEVGVAFEPLGVRGLLPLTNAFHAVVVLSNGTAFEGNPSGNFQNWGWLTARERALAARPLKTGSIVKEAGGTGETCPDLVRRLRQMTRQINNARLPYWPTPETKWDSVNSNSFTFWAVSRLNLQPPAPPNGWTTGETPGYYGAIAGGDR